jgi:hypothetical protein
MEENPYRSPAADTERRPLPPLWRRIVSLPLIIFGAGYSFAILEVGVEMVEHGFTLRLVILFAVSVAGAGMLWLGLRLRRSR